jgi:hypothetical protein
MRFDTTPFRRTRDAEVPRTAFDECVQSHVSRQLAVQPDRTIALELPFGRVPEQLEVAREPRVLAVDRIQVEARLVESDHAGGLKESMEHGQILGDLHARIPRQDILAADHRVFPEPLLAQREAPSIDPPQRHPREETRLRTDPQQVRHLQLQT